MNTPIKTLLASLFILNLSWLTGCSSDKSEQEVIVEFDNTEIQFNADLGNYASQEQFVSGSIIGNPDNLYIFADLTQTDLVQSVDMSISGSTGRLYFTPTDEWQLGPGQFSDTIEVRVCTDSGCRNEVTGSPQNIVVNYTVEGDTGFTLESNHVTINSTYRDSEFSPFTQNISFTSNFNQIFSRTPGQATWLSIDLSTSSKTIGFEIVEDLPPGVYTTTVSIGIFGTQWKTLRLNIQWQNLNLICPYPIYNSVLPQMAPRYRVKSLI